MSQPSSPEPFYSMTRRAGDLLFLSGFGPVGPDLEVVGADIEEQTRFTMLAMERVLTAEGASWADVVRANVYLLDMADRDGFNRAYMEFFQGIRPPTRRVIGAGDLFKGILVEIDCVVYSPQQPAA